MCENFKKDIVNRIVKLANDSSSSDSSDSSNALFITVQSGAGYIRPNTTSINVRNISSITIKPRSVLQKRCIGEKSYCCCCFGTKPVYEYYFLRDFNLEIDMVNGDEHNFYYETETKANTVLDAISTMR